MATNINDISAIHDGEEGEILEDDSVVEIESEDIFDLLKRSFNKRGATSRTGSFYQSLDGTLGGGDGDGDTGGDLGLKKSNANKASKKEVKALKDLDRIREELNDSFNAFDDKVSNRRPSIEITNEIPPHSKPNVADSSFLRDLELHRVLRDTERGKENVSDDDIVCTGCKKGSETTKLIPKANEQRKRELLPSTPDRRVERQKPQVISAQTAKSSSQPSTALKSASGSASSSPSSASSSLIPSSVVSKTAKPTPLRKVVLNAQPASSTPKRGRVSNDRPDNLKPVLDPTALKTSTPSSVRSRPVKRAMSPIRSPDQDPQPQTKRTRWDEQPKRVEPVNLTQGRPLLAASSRTRTSSLSSAFRPPRAGPMARAHVRARTTVPVEQDAEYNRQEMLAKTIDEKYDHVIFIDLDNWVNFFGHLRAPLPSKAFVWGFWGKLTKWVRPRWNVYFQQLETTGRFEETIAGSSKDAADFAMVLKLGQMDKDIKKRDIGFTIVTGDRGFHQVQEDFKWAKRSVNVINPHILNRNPYGIDDAIRSQCRRSQSVEPKLRNFALNADLRMGRDL